MPHFHLIAVALLVVAFPANADVVIDGSMGGVRRELPGPDHDIGARLGSRVGANLFHSFERFDLLDSESATFTGPASVARVIARVTGGEASSIAGLLEVAIPDADLWFLNPRGVVFGPKAVVRIDGSLFVSTADELLFTDGARFAARGSGLASLTVAPPEAFGFLGRDAGAILLNETNLLIVPDRRVTLVGGDIAIDDGSIELAPADRDHRGDVTLIAMSRPGRVDVMGATTSAPPEGSVQMTGARRGRTIQGRVIPYEDGINISSRDSSGRVRIRAGELDVEGADIRADNFADEDSSARIDIAADRVRLTDNANVRSRAFGAGRGGDLLVRAGTLELVGGALLRSETQASGDTGGVRVAAERSILISRAGTDELTSIGSETIGGGRAGEVIVAAPAIEIRDSGTIFSTSRTDAEGDGGRLQIRAGHLLLEGGAQIASAVLDESRGQGGKVMVDVQGDLTIRGQSRQINEVSMEPEPSGIFTNSETRVSGAGSAGSLTVKAGRILLQDRGEIASEGFMNDARAGSVTVAFGERLTIDDAEITTKANRADAGDITVRGEGILHMLDGGEISTSVLDKDSRGNAGTVTVGSDLAVLNGSEIKANGVIGQGGDIDIAAGQFLQSQDSEVEALSEVGIDGSVSLDAPDTDVVGQLTVLPGVFVDASNLLRPGCGDQAAGRGAGTFGSTGNGRLPDGPEAPLVAGYSNGAGPLTITGSFLLGTGC